MQGKENIYFSGLESPEFELKGANNNNSGFELEMDQKIGTVFVCYDT